AYAAGERSVVNVHIELAPPIHLKDPTGGPTAEERPIEPRPVTRELSPIKAPAHIGKTEVADQAMGDPISLECGESGVFRRYFSAVDELHAPDLERLTLLAAQTLEADISLLGKYHRGIGVMVGREVICTQAELSLRTRRYGPIRQTK